MDTRKEEYTALVKKRKAHKFRDAELTNPAATRFDVDEIEPWAQWQNNLHATVLVVGQEFCDVDTYIRTEAKVERHPDRYEYPSNKNLREYLQLLGLDPGHPAAPNRANPVFFTNCVMGLKKPPMSANFKPKWMLESGAEFLLPLIKLIRPRVIIPIGNHATRSLGQLLHFKVGAHGAAVQNHVEREGMVICPVYHTGGLGFRHRPRAQQLEDWSRVKKWL